MCSTTHGWRKLKAAFPARILAGTRYAYYCRGICTVPLAGACRRWCARSSLAIVRWYTPFRGTQNKLGQGSMGMSPGNPTPSGLTVPKLGGVFNMGLDELKSCFVMVIRIGKCFWGTLGSLRCQIWANNFLCVLAWNM